MDEEKILSAIRLLNDNLQSSTQKLEQHLTLIREAVLGLNDRVSHLEKVQIKNSLEPLVSDVWIPLD